jgi:hypothetical protein
MTHTKKQHHKRRRRDASASLSASEDARDASSLGTTAGARERRNEKLIPNLVEIKH